MKILLVSTSSGSRGGGEFYLHSLSQGLTELGHSVVTLMSHGAQMDELAELFYNSSLQVERFDYLNTYHRKFRSVGAAWARRDIRNLQYLLDKSDCDIVHLNLQCVEDGLDLVQAAHRCRKPSVATVHVTRSMTDLRAVGGTLRDATARRVFKACQTPLIGISRISAVDLSRFVNRSEQLADSLQKNNLPPGCPVYSVPNGVAIPRQASRKQLRAQWGIPENAFLLGCVARIEEQKNPLFIVSLMKNLPSAFHFVWVGDGRQRKALETAIQQAGLEGRIHLPGWQANASSQIIAFDLLVLPSLYEGLPLALLEAMALGVPCIASDVDGICDAIEDQISGYLCPVNQTNAWTNRILDLHSSLAKRQQIGNAGQLRHSTQFSLMSMAQRTATVYEHIINHSSPHTHA